MIVKHADLYSHSHVGKAQFDFKLSIIRMLSGTRFSTKMFSDGAVVGQATFLIFVHLVFGSSKC